MPLKNDAVAAAIRYGKRVKLADGNGLFLVARKPGRAYWVTQFRIGHKFTSKSPGPAASLTPAAARRAREAFAVRRRSGALATATAPATAMAGPPRHAPREGGGKRFGEAHETYRRNVA